MADSFTAFLSLRKPEVGAANDTWGGPAGLNGDLDILDGIFNPAGTGTSVGMNVGAGKTLNATGGTVLVTDAQFEIRNNTRHARFSAINAPGGATTDYLLPPAGDTLVGRDQAQTLTNKTAPDPPAGDNSQKLVPAHWVNAAIASAVSAALAAYSAFATGDIIASSNSTRPGWVRLRGGTLGNAGSGATERANADCANLFAHFWSINTNAWTINGGRGASAAADFAALKTITLPNADGMALVGVGGAVALGVFYATTGSATATMTAANLPAHHHDVTMSSLAVNVGAGSPVNVMTTTGTTATADTGSGTGHANVQPSMGVVYWIRL